MRLEDSPRILRFAFLAAFILCAFYTSRFRMTGDPADFLAWPVLLVVTALYTALGIMVMGPWNPRVIGMYCLLAGGASNCLVIAANGFKMPVEGLEEAFGAVHVPMTDEHVLTFLADVIGPMSIGDVLMFLGCLIILPYLVIDVSRRMK